MTASRLRPLLVPGLFTFAALAVLIGLGSWQLSRLAWKSGLIAQVEARAHGAPAALPPPAAWPAMTAEVDEYRRVSVTGTYRHEAEAYLYTLAGDSERPGQAGRPQGQGYLVLTPLVTADGTTVIVNRGFVPASLAAKSTRPQSEVAGEVALTGLMRPPQPRNLFTPADDPSHGLYFSRDPAPIAAHFGLAHVAPFVVDADKTKIAGGWPEGGLTNVDIPNNHMEYAMTWFGLAGGLWIVVGTYIFGALRERRAKAKA